MKTYLVVEPDRTSFFRTNADDPHADLFPHGNDGWPGYLLRLDGEDRSIDFPFPERGYTLHLNTYSDGLAQVVTEKDDGYRFWGNVVSLEDAVQQVEHELGL